MNKDYNSALKINEGISQPKSINEKIISKLKTKAKNLKDIDYFVNGILASNKAILSQAITLVESTLQEHQQLANEIIKQCKHKITSSSIRIGITGIPGVGKSSFIEVLGQKIIDEGRKLAVLAIDPSSQKSKGSILGDKTRMEKLAGLEDAYIRPSPSKGSLGGVARKTRETIILCEAAGFNTIFIETVGVGQSETAVHSMVDYFLLLLLAGAGDELQGIKRGIIEMANGIAVTKADGDNIEKANMAKAELKNVMHLFPLNESKWQPEVFTVSAKYLKGIDEIWENISNYITFTTNNGYLNKKRANQSLFWFYEAINESLKNDFFLNKIINNNIDKVKNDILNGNANPFESAKYLIDLYKSKRATEK